jgi:hypothetical protein
MGGAKPLQYNPMTPRKFPEPKLEIPRNPARISTKLLELANLCEPFRLQDSKGPEDRLAKMAEMNPTLWANQVNYKTTNHRLPDEKIKVLKLLEKAFGKSTPMGWFMLRNHRLALISTVAILLDLEYSSVSLSIRPPGTKPTYRAYEKDNDVSSRIKRGSCCVPAVIEHMLLFDYGVANQAIPSEYWKRHDREGFMCFVIRILRFAVHCSENGRIPPDCQCVRFSDCLQDFFRGQCEYVAELVTTLNWFWIHRAEPSAEECEMGWTGYEGVLNYMVSEIESTGTRRLTYKLSMDANIMIPRFIKDEARREELCVRARALAARHGISILSSAEDHEKLYHCHVPPFSPPPPLPPPQLLVQPSVPPKPWRPFLPFRTRSNNPNENGKRKEKEKEKEKETEPPSYTEATDVK